MKSVNATQMQKVFEVVWSRSYPTKL